MSTQEQARQDGDTYGLQRNTPSSIRLNAQHYIWKDAVGGNLHSRIAVNNASTTRVADIGTGTGIWMHDMKREYPAIQIDGFDISLEQAPHPAWLPPDIRLHKLDVTKAIPDEFCEQFDIIHLRLFLAVVQDNDASPIIRNLISMLKPGGWLQWAEHPFQDLGDVRVEAPSPDVSSTAMQAYLDLAQAGSDKKWAWVPKLPRTFSSLGLIDVESSSPPSKPYTWLYSTQLIMGAVLEISYQILDNSTPESKGPVMRRIIEAACGDMRNGVYLTYSPLVVIGRKRL
ncbi:S-adenosyl-L-methionine-dependent methyltransferase [Pseudovirgaria hyperparasitica]|uniref:S-adenosyl-L-methionine-dependent methyltransferase n=1 Tax=Pseudovirgaria hyperparasitica TaxID=470096 RepID=A0A6A6W8U2_9PEZI|nr:S-adenosyl-L-methionine-dependent methyltransferase [Pseudovirgaria hyperparasitica]KAF2758444.1 S-adenosyl-L-methionine-dependent methyltransferase [Pseudovirgaria hyperparasitica]